jgi:hypothetical protein
VRVSDRKIRACFLVLIAVVLMVVGAFAWSACTDNRSAMGRVIRWARGETGASQIVNDLAEDIRNDSSLSQLRSWGWETLARFRAGAVQTNGVSDYLPDHIRNVRLAMEERPEFIRSRWGETNSFGAEEPELVVVVSTNGQPEHLVVSWYLHGIVIGQPDDNMPFKPWCSAKAQPGIYTYHFYK